MSDYEEEFAEDFDDTDIQENEIDEIFTDSDDDGAGDEQDADVVPQIVESEEILTAKNGLKWARHPEAPMTSRVITTIRVPSGSDQTRAAETPLDHFKLFIIDDMMDIIVKNTNKKIKDLTKNQKKQQRYVSQTNVTEITALIGILFYSGITKAWRQQTVDLWSWKFGPPLFRVSMSRNRFLFLMRALRFDDYTHRNKEDKFSAIRDIWSRFVVNCVTQYNPGTYLTVDETIVGTRARCPFKTYMKAKPDKYGIKLYNLCDPRTGYLCNSIPYLGKQETELAAGPSGIRTRAPQRGRSKTRLPQASTTEEVSKTTKYVLDLVKPYLRSGRVVVCDNYYTSFELYEKLKSIGLTMIGTVRKNKPEVPETLKQCGRAFSQITRFAFHKNVMIASYVPKPQKLVLLMSSAHNNNEIDEETQKPRIILDYNAHKGGVDTFDSLMKKKSTVRNTRRWPMRMFFMILDAAGINAHIIQNLKGKIDRMEFMKKLAYQLVEKQVQQRKNNTRVPLALRLQMAKFLDVELPTTEEDSQEEESETETGEERPTQACVICAPIRKRHASTYCSICILPVCGQHHEKIKVCTRCVPS